MDRDLVGARWIDLEGAVNVRDLGGLPTVDGGVVLTDRLIRADNLQSLTAADVRRLVDDHGVRRVADLRTGIEVDNEGPGPMTREPLVAIHHLSLFPEAGRNTDAAADDQDAPVLLPWQTEEAANRGSAAAGIYLRYLEHRADSVLATLRLIGSAEGATIVHCAAGKDRTGTVIAVALAEVGVTPAAIVADYARSAERLEAIFFRLGASPTYFQDVAEEQIDKHRPKPETMQNLLTMIDEVYGGASAWLRSNGWTESDATALRRALLG